ncbi:MAG: hypothetical protein AAFX93_09250 [Verrucomicrobiota bacterium]
MNLRRLFNRLTVREKLLMCGFVWVILLICFGFGLKNFRGMASRWSTSGNLLSEQQGFLNLAPEIEVQLQEELEFFNSDRTLDRSALAGRVDSLARQTGVNLVNFKTRSQERDIYDLHIMRLSIRDTSLEKLMAFDAALEKESPYINQVSVSLDANRRNPDLLDATIILNSFELNPGGL